MMPEILFFIKDLELGTKLSSTCIDLGFQVEFSDENSPGLIKSNIPFLYVIMPMRI